MLLSEDSGRCCSRSVKQRHRVARSATSWKRSGAVGTTRGTAASPLGLWRPCGLPAVVTGQDVAGGGRWRAESWWPVTVRCQHGEVRRWRSGWLWLWPRRDGADATAARQRLGPGVAATKQSTAGLGSGRPGRLRGGTRLGVAVARGCRASGCAGQGEQEGDGAVTAVPEKREEWSGSWRLL